MNEGIEQREGKWAGGRLGGWVGVACVKDGMGRQRVRDEWGRVGGWASGKGGADAMCLVFVFYEFSFHCVDFLCVCFVVWKSRVVWLFDKSLAIRLSV